MAGVTCWSRIQRFFSSAFSSVAPMMISVPGRIRRSSSGRPTARGRVRMSSAKASASSPDGAFLGLLGPNGAGKTTLIGSVCTTVRPTARTLSVFGHDHRSRQARRLLGGGHTKSLDHVYSMESIILLPLGFLGGVFHSVQLPPFWDFLSRLDPVFWLVQVERIGFLGRGDVGAGWALAVVRVLAAALTAWSAAMFATDRLKP